MNSPRPPSPITSPASWTPPIRAAARPPAGVRFGASPRAAIGLAAASRARALLNGRVHVGHEDVQACAPAVLGHRIILDYQARLEGRTGPSLTADLLAEVPAHPKEMPSTLAAAKI